MQENQNVAPQPLGLDRIVNQGTTLQASCPCCHEQLAAGAIEERPVLYCAKCLGVLMKNEHFGAVLADRRARRGGAAGETPRPIDPRQYDRKLYCPGCDSLMDVHPYYGPGNVVIDSCHHCGYLWLDHGELTRLERAGGREVHQIHAGLGYGGFAGYVSSPSMEPDDEQNPLRVVADLLF